MSAKPSKFEEKKRLKERGLDPKEWSLKEFELKEWQQATRDGTKTLESVRIKAERKLTVKVVDGVAKELEKLNRSKTRQPLKSGEILYEIGIADTHIGSTANGSIEAQAKELCRLCRLVIDRAPSGTVRILFLVGGDVFHFDNLDGLTTRGTRLGDAVGQEYAKVVRFGIASLTHLIDYAAERFKVDVLFVPGNHDRNTMIAVGECLKHVYKKDPRVSIVSSE